MKDDSTAKSLFEEIENQNPAVALALLEFRAGRPAGRFLRFDARQKAAFIGLRRTRWTIRRVWRIYIALAWLAVGLIVLGIIVGPTFWKDIRSILLPAGGFCLGVSAVLLVSRVGAAPLRTVYPPNVLGKDPVQELRDLAERSASRLRAAYRLQLWTVVAVGIVLVGLIVWSIIMVSQKRILYASAFGSGGMAMVILTQWKWQPFDRINQARRLADDADALGTGLRLRMETISEIEDPAEREKAQWRAVSEYLDRS